LLPGDRFIVRQFSPVVTIGGGAVLDPLARRPMLRDYGNARRFWKLSSAQPRGNSGAMTERALLGLGHDETVAARAWTDHEIRDTAKKLFDTGHAKTVSTEPLLAGFGEAFAEVRRKILEKVEQFQKDNPLLPGNIA